MSGHVEKATVWMYRGLWGVLTHLFRVPSHPPTLPAAPGEQVQSFRPAEGFLRYLKFQFWIAFVVIDLVIFAFWLVVLAASPKWGFWLLPVALALAVIPDILAYLAIHLRYDTTWYVLTQRSLRIRGGIWTIHEATITFENIQNVTVESGPLERWFGIGNVVVDTAGGGQGGRDPDGRQTQNLHRGEIKGVSNAADIRQLILSRLLRSRTAGLGDDHAETPGWTAQHVAVLREIRDAVR
jgi:membrane protein YdbS with pleckstrin-like domain